jgi:hypothetical protein
MDVWMGINALINVINLGLLTLLVITYVRIHRSSKARFTLGLIFFSGLLMINSIISVYSYFTMAQLFSDELTPYLLAISLAELVGLSIFLKITLE